MNGATLVVNMEELEVLQTALQKMSKLDSNRKVTVHYNKVVSVMETIELQEFYMSDPRND